jgi:hypothetical protein
MEDIFLYHRVPNYPIYNDLLMPLNQLKNENPFLYSEYIKSYRSRKKTLMLHVPPLGCLWNDVIYMSPIHPHKYRLMMDRIGRQPAKELSFFQIPARSLDPKLCTIWKFEFEGDNPKTTSINDYMEFNEENLCLTTKFPEVTIKHYESIGNDKSKSLWLHWGIPHIMYKGTIETTNLVII